MTAPWFAAAYHGSCSGCGEDIEPDDEIRADGDGGWQRRECCGEDEDDDLYDSLGESRP